MPTQLSKFNHSHKVQQPWRRESKAARKTIAHLYDAEQSLPEPAFVLMLLLSFTIFTSIVKHDKMPVMTPEVVGTIEHIAVHPVKSAAMLEVDKAYLTSEGIEAAGIKDRQFMVVRAIPDENGIYQFVTQRDKRDAKDKFQGLAVLSLIKPQMAGDTLVLTWQGNDPIEVPKDRTSGNELHVQVWEHITHAVDQGEELSEWLSDHLQTPAKLVRAAGSFHRLAKQNYIKNNNPLRFQDAYPIHWFLQESVAELAEKAREEISWRSFRPTLVVVGSSAQTEHQIYAGTIAGIPFVQPKPCDRCRTTNVDQETGDIKLSRALKPLGTYKNWINNRGELTVIFGENMLPQGEGEIAKGDEIVVCEFRNQKLKYGTKAEVIEPNA
jgi:uncharacterized protein